jgi:hypothetical protein
LSGWTLMYPNGAGVGMPTHYFDRDRATYFKVPPLPRPTPLALHYRMRCRTTASLTGKETCLITPGMSSLSALVWRGPDRSPQVSDLPQFARPAPVEMSPGEPPPARRRPPGRQRPSREWEEDVFGTPRRPSRTPPGWPP